jgi:hypothetical protein
MDQKRPLAQGAGRGNVISVYEDRVEFVSGWRGQNVASVGLKQIVNVTTRGVINCTLTVEVNDGRRITVDHMALPDARQVKAAIENRKSTAGLYE